MGKLALSTSKYNIIANFRAKGVVEKADVIGALFGQTEGLLGPDMDLRELQKTGRIGRIEVKVETREGRAGGEIKIPSSLDSSETALIGACIETIERVGPCNAQIRVSKIEDVRISKRKYLIERAKELLIKIYAEGVPEIEEISEQLKKAVRSSEMSKYKGLSCGPNIEANDSIIIVEGRADVVKLLRVGIKNIIAIEGTSVPKAVVELSKRKISTAFLDGDRGGDLILKELSSLTEIDSVARAPWGKEVEELSKKEIFKALREKMPFDQAKKSNGVRPPSNKVRSTSTTSTTRGPPRRERVEFKKKEVRKPRSKKITKEKMEKYKKILSDLTGSKAAYLLDDSDEIMGKVPIRELFNALNEINAATVIIDGNIDQKLVGLGSKKGVKYIVGTKLKERIRSSSVYVLTLKDFE